MRHHEQPDYYVDPNQAARYGGSDFGDSYAPYDSYDPYDRGPEPTPWYRRPVALIATGAVGMVVLALAAYGVVTLAGGGSKAPQSTITTPAPATTAATTTAVTTTVTTTASAARPTDTATETAPPEPTYWSTDTGTPTIPTSPDTGTPTMPPSTVPISPSTSTITQTVTVTPSRRPLWPPHF